MSSAGCRHLSLANHVVKSLKSLLPVTRWMARGSHRRWWEYIAPWAALGCSIEILWSAMGVHAGVQGLLAGSEAEV